MAGLTTRVLVLNAGSSSLKWSLLDGARTTIDSGDQPWAGNERVARAHQLEQTLRALPRFDAVGHRVVSGGSRFLDAVLIDATVRASLEASVSLDPIHMAPALAGIDAAEAGSARAALAYEQLRWSLRRSVGAMAGVLGGLDAIVFTGGIGEHCGPIREAIASALELAGLRLDPAANRDGAGDRVVSAPDSKVSALVLHAREDLPILAEVLRLTGV